MVRSKGKLLAVYGKAKRRHLSDTESIQFHVFRVCILDRSKTKNVQLNSTAALICYSQTPLQRGTPSHINSQVALKRRISLPLNFKRCFIDPTDYTFFFSLVCLVLSDRSPIEINSALSPALFHPVVSLVLLWQEQTGSFGCNRTQQ